MAPSPTGTLHLGTARTALFNWLFAKKEGGTFLLRIEDTDIERSREEYINNIYDGLQWLGINWDESPTIQSERVDEHKQIIKTLVDKGFAYKCYASEAAEQRCGGTARCLQAVGRRGAGCSDVPGVQ